MQTAPASRPATHRGAFPGQGLPVFLRIGLRELRGGLKGFRIFLACLALGVAAIAAVGSVASAISRGIEAEGQILLGGDVDLRLSYREATAREINHLTQTGTVSVSHELRAIAKNPANDARTLVELKAVDGNYPLYGAITLRDGTAIARALGQQDGYWGAVIEAPLAERLSAQPGDLLQIGELQYRLTDIIAREPDRLAGGMALGPRVMISGDSLDATGLVQPGSLIWRHYRVKLADGVSLPDWIADLKARFPDAEWRLRTRDNGAPGVRQFVERMSLFLTLVGLTALIVGGVGVGNAVRGYLERQRDTIATLKCLGATGGTIFRIYLTQILILAFFGVCIGLAIGAGAPLLLETLLADRVPIPTRFMLYPQPLVEAAAFGLITALSFAVWPLARAREISPAGLFRALVAPERHLPRLPYILLTGGCGLLLVGLAFAIAEDPRFAVWFTGGIAGSFILFRVSALGLMALARRMPRLPRPEFRLALGNLHRPGAQTPTVMLSLGLGLTLLVVITLVEGNIARQVDRSVPEKAPSFFFVDIPAADKDAFLELTGGMAGVSAIEIVPTLRGRVTGINGKPAVAADMPAEARWILRGDRVLSYAATRPANATLTAGEWWPEDYRGPPLLSFDTTLAQAMGIGIGDRISIKILGREIEAEIANLRFVDWGNLSVNFAMIYSPGLISAAPHNYVATARTETAAETGLHRAVTDKFPGISTIRVKEALETVDNVLRQLASAVRAAGSVTLLSGVLVLAGAMAAGQGQRHYDAVILKVLGATRWRILTPYILEYAMLGLMAALLATLAGGIIAYGVVTQIMRGDWTFLPIPVAVTLVSATFMTILLGLTTTWHSLQQKSAPLLRNS